MSRVFPYSFSRIYCENHCIFIWPSCCSRWLYAHDDDDDDDYDDDDDDDDDYDDDDDNDDDDDDDDEYEGAGKEEEGELRMKSEESVVFQGVRVRCDFKNSVR